MKFVRWQINLLALERALSGRIAADWYNAATFTVDINLTDGAAHKVSLYCLDWTSAGLAQTVQVQDANSGKVLDTQTISSFSGGT